ncbi:MAG: hypothetical protein MUC31_06530, partial [Bacteroidales bacterium]|nr:hypothetical protein [Bacteroidales bacterium]
MKKIRLRGPGVCAGILIIVFFCPGLLKGQTYDTLSNWDGITPTWYASTPGCSVVENPLPAEVNPSAHCYKFVTGSGLYDFMITQLAEPVDFTLYPRYRLKVLAPASGGFITLKFENYNNTSSHEIVLTPIPGEWTDLEYNF